MRCSDPALPDSRSLYDQLGATAGTGDPAMSGRGAPPLSRAESRDVFGRRGATVWFTGMPAAGKTTLAAAVERALVEANHSAYLLDGDEVRRDLCGDLGFDRRGRAENVRRVAHAARLLADAGVVVLVALISPYAVDREDARQLHRVLDIPFVEVFLDTPVMICERRNPKGMYVACPPGGDRQLHRRR